MLIACIIPSSCSEKTIAMLKKCISSLRHEAKKIIIYIVSDNQIGRTKILKEKIDNFLLVDNQLGFSERNNVAIIEILNFYDPDYFLFINDDAYLASDFFREFEKICKQKNVDLLAPLIFKPKSTQIDSFGIEYFSSGYAKNSKQFNTSTTLATAACLLVNTRVLTLIKKRYGFYFNPLIKWYIEDVEFSIRALSIGATIQKSQKLIVYHKGSATSGQKSFYIMYKSYQNLLWLIIIAWPTKTIIKNSLNILIFQLWAFLYSSYFYGPHLYGKIFYESSKNILQLYKMRKTILGKYPKSFVFEKMLSPYMFRFRNGKTIKIY